jgi:hypothetical protein
VDNRVRLTDAEFATLRQESQAKITYRPFWVFTTEMPIALLQLWDQVDDTSGFDIYVPGYNLSWEDALLIGTRLTSWQPDYVLGGHSELRGCIVTRAKALELAPLIYMRALQEMDYNGSEVDVQHLPLLSSKLMAIPQQNLKERSI